MCATYRLAIDTLGADIAASELVKGALDFADANHDFTLVLIGHPQDLQGLENLGHETIEADEWISQSDSILKALRGKSRPSMRIGLELVGGRKADGLVTTGNTGALVSLSRHLLESLPGIHRPAIIKGFQGKKSCFWMLDLGANLTRGVKCFVDNALLGSAYAEGVGRVSSPRVALLNIGEEAKKGPKVVQEAANELRDDPRVNFVGFIEAAGIFDGVADVVVTDGFSGNVALKAMEGTTGMVQFLLRKEFEYLGQDGAHWRKGLEARLMGTYNPQTYNGASFVGLDGVVVKSHGGTDRTGFAQALHQAAHEVISQVPARVQGSYQAISQRS